jgi:hypothetical protein
MNYKNHNPRERHNQHKIKTHSKLQKLALFLLLVFCISIIGCNGFVSGDDGRRDQDFKTGSGSLTFSFMQNAPPQKIFQNQRADVIIKLQNEGASDIRSGVLLLLVDKGVFELKEGNVKYYDLRKKSTSFPQGEMKLVSFEGFALPLTVESQVRETTILAQSCYEYQTEVLQTVCIDFDPYNMYPNSNKDVCQAKTVSPGATGGPVKVTSIEPRYSVRDDVVQPNFVITVSKITERAQSIFASGRSNLFCSSAKFNPEDVDKVRIYVELSDVQLACDRDEFTLYQNQAQITCSGFGQQSFTGTYEAPIYIRLDYGVSETITQKVSIVR